MKIDILTNADREPHGSFLGNNQYSGKTVYERFWEKVDRKDDSECWEWLGSRHHQWRYGHFVLDGKHIAAHRASWILNVGDIPSELIVCHKCDNPPCVNPNHLFLGTYKDNAQDKVRKHRCNCGGTHNGRAKLDTKDVFLIRELHEKGHSGAELGRMFGVKKETIYKIFNGSNWSHI